MEISISADSSWKETDTHFIRAIENPWYRSLVEMNHLISKYTMLFYNTKNIKTMHLPITTGSISSPMGLGSDSLPVKVNFSSEILRLLFINSFNAYKKL